MAEEKEQARRELTLEDLLAELNDLRNLMVSSDTSLANLDTINNVVLPNIRQLADRLEEIEGRMEDLESKIEDMRKSKTTEDF